MISPLQVSLEKNAGTAETPNIEETFAQVPTITANIEQYLPIDNNQSIHSVKRGVVGRNADEPCDGLLPANRIALVLRPQVSYLLGGFEMKLALSHLHIDRINIMLEKLARDLYNDSATDE